MEPDGLGALVRLEAGALAATHDVLRRLRAEAPVRFVPDNGCYAVSRYEDIVAVLRDPQRFSSRAVTGPAAGPQLMHRLAAGTASPALTGALAALLPGGTGAPAAPPLDHRRAARIAAVMARGFERHNAVLLSADPPAHSRHRRLVTHAFSPRRVAGKEASIRAVAGELIGGFAGAGVVELVGAYADPLPMRVIARALGVADRALADFRRWSGHLVSVVGNPALRDDEVAAYIRTLVEFGAYFSAVVARRRADPSDDLITDIAVSHLADDGELAVGEILPMLQQFLVAGNETTAKLIAWTVWLLLRRPDLAAAVRDDPTLTLPVVDEVLRLHTPVIGLYRQANEDTEVGGCPIPVGSHLWLLYGSGNRDERQFPDPDEFRLNRANVKQHLAFGSGPHYCVGATLARTEAAIAVNELLARLGKLRPAAGRPAPDFARSHVLYGLRQLWVEFTPR